MDTLKRCLGWVGGGGRGKDGPEGKEGVACKLRDIQGQRSKVGYFEL